MTEGPARLTVTLLPRKRPTPMAPPIAIMDSCGSESFRCRWEALTAWSVGDPFWSDSFVIVIAGLPDTGPLWRMLQNGASQRAPYSSIGCDPLESIYEYLNFFMRVVMN